MITHLFCNSPCATFIRELPAPSIPVLSLLKRRIILHKMTVFIGNLMLIQPFFCPLTDRTLGIFKKYHTYSLLFIYHTIPAWFHAPGSRTMDFAPLWNILCEVNTSLAADPFGYMECLCLSTPNICSEKNIFRYIVSEIK